MDLLGLLKDRNALCCGCGACYNICPKDAISKISDPQGFLYPCIDKSACIDCGQCERICPKLHWYTGNAKEPECFAARAHDDVRFFSSSGGIFTLLAEWILDQGGIVCGAAMEKDYSVHHICVDNKQDLAKLRQSKYVQSDTEFVFREIATALKADRTRKVLFTGTPCQVAAARNFFGKNENVYFADVLCHGVPSEQMWKDYIKENFDASMVERIEFRSKRNGWRADQLRVFYNDGTSAPIPWPESAYEEGFQRNISLRDGCDNCEFAGKQRQGDLTMGDFWRVEDYNPLLNDHKGTSVILVNNEKGQVLLESIRHNLYHITSVPFDVPAKHNRMQKKFTSHPQKSRFKTLYPKTHNFSTSVMQCRHSLYDIGLVAYYTVPNFGGEIIQYALYKTLTNMGYSVLMIGQPTDSKAQTPSVPFLFNKNPYPRYACSKFFPSIAEMKFLNKQCKTFISGSDQMFNNNGYTWFNKFMVQNFVYDSHRKIAYAASWGHDRIWGSEYDRAEESYFIKKFDYFSVRERSAVELCEREFGVRAEWVLDPVFLCDVSEWQKLAKSPSQSLPKNNYIFSYVLDSDREKEASINWYAQTQNLSICIIFDAEKKLDSIKTSFDNVVVKNPKVEDWLALIANSEFVITDSFHGACFCVLFHKQFMVFVNKRRGLARFSSMLSLFHLEDRIVYTAKELEEKARTLSPIDYDQVDAILEAEKERSLAWLYNAIEEDKDVRKPLSEYDILDNRCDRIRVLYDRQLADLKAQIAALQEQLGKKAPVQDTVLSALKKKKETVSRSAFAQLKKRLKRLKSRSMPFWNAHPYLKLLAKQMLQKMDIDV